MGRQKHNKLRIGIDIDNVVINSTQAVIDYYNSRTGDSLRECDIKTYDVSQYVQPEFRDCFYELFWNEKALEKVKPLPYCQQTIKSLFHLGHEIYFVTATTPQYLPFKYNLLKEYFPYMDIGKALIVAQDKHMVNVDVLIDDYWGNCVNAPYYSILLDYPWNVNYDDAEYEKIFRVPNWRYIVPMVEVIEKLKGVK